MSDHGTHHHHDGDHSTEIKSKTSFQASFWVVLILIGLFIGAVNFISVMGHEEGGHGATEQSHGAPGAHGTGGNDAAGGHEGAGHQTGDHSGSNNAHSIGTADHSGDEKEAGSDSAAHH